MKKHRSQRGQGLAEYALIIALVAILVIGVASAMGFGIQPVYGLAQGPKWSRSCDTK